MKRYLYIGLQRDIHLPKVQIHLHKYIIEHGINQVVARETTVELSVDSSEDYPLVHGHNLVTDSACDSMDAAKNESAILTAEQLKIVQDQWAVLAKNKKQSGVDIFIALFTHYPPYQDLFKMLKGLSLEELKSSPKMKAHGLTFMHGLQGFIENLDDLETLVELVRKNAERHGGRGISVDAFHKTFGLFPAILKSKLGDAFDESSQEAWGIVVKTMESVTTARLEEFYKDMGERDQ